MVRQLDDLLTHLGTGRWSVLHFIVLSFCSVFLAPQALGGAFLAPRLEYSCRLNNSNNVASVKLSSLLSETNSSSFVTSRNECQYTIDTPEGKIIEECTEFHFDNSTFSSTFTSEYQLGCDRSYLQTSFQSMYMLGYFVASPVSGYLSDKYGRKIMLRLGYVGFLLLDLMSAWLPLLSTILVSRFFLGCLHAVCASVSFVLMIEVMEPKMRTVAGITEGNFWAASIMLYGGLAYFIRDWRILQTAVTLPALLILPVLCFIDESPRWLFINGKPQEALLVLGKVAKWHNVEVPPEAAMTELVDELQETRASTTQQQLSLWVLFKSIIHGALMLFRTPRLRIITLFIYVDFLMVGMVYFGLSLSGTNISENPFVYMVLSGVMEVPAYSLTIPIVHRYGRKRTLSVLFVISGIILLCLAFSSAAKSTVAVTLALMGKVTITGSFQIAIIFSGELFPTEVRSRGVSTSCMMSRLGGIVAPFITDVVGTVYPWAPFFVFGLGALIAGAGTLLLPETSNQKMPETVGQLESREPLRRKLRSAPV